MVEEARQALHAVIDRLRCVAGAALHREVEDVVAEILMSAKHHD